MKPLALILAFAAVSAAQKPLKSGKKPAYIAHAPGGGADHSAQAYQAASPQSSVSNHGGFGGGHHGGGGGGSFSSGIGKAGSKPTFPLLLSDTRTLNPDGTINFDYKADNGLHQGETVDSDGTRRGFYSYPGADGKLITVKYTAGKNGFVAEGPHLPTQPQSAPYNPKQDDIYSSGKQGSFGGGLGGGHYSQQAPAHHGGGGSQGAYRQGASGLGGQGHNQAQHYSHSSIGGAGSLGGQGGGNAFANFPDFSSHFPSSSSGHGGAPSYSSGGGSGGRYSGAGAALSGLGGAGQHISGHPGGSSSFSSLGGLGGGHGGANLADLGSSLGAQYSGPMFTANNPYQPSLTSANPANPVNAGFDLGNGGHFAINFSPGVGQEYTVNPNEISGNYGGGQGGHDGGAASYSGGSGHGSGAQGRY